MIDMPEDMALWQRYVLQDDKEALATLFERKYSILHRVAVHVTGNNADADDAVQNALEQLLVQIPKTTVQTVQPWLIGVVLNNARSIVRREVRVHQRHVKKAETDSYNKEENPADDFARVESIELLRDLLAELPRHYREPLVMHYMEGMKFKDIAEILGRKEETVKKQSQRGLASLRSMLGKRGLSLTAALLVSFLHSVYASEELEFSYQAQSTIESSGLWWQKPVLTVLSIAAIILIALSLRPLLDAQNESHVQEPINNDTAVSKQIPIETAVEELDQKKKKKWNRSRIGEVLSCPFGILEAYEPAESDLKQAHSIALPGEDMFEEDYWQLKPVRANFTMFETKQLPLKDQFHMQFEFKMHDSKDKASVMLGFFFNRTGNKKHIQKLIDKPDQSILQDLNERKDDWHLINIEVLELGAGSALGRAIRDVTYSVNGQVYWRGQTSLPARDIVPIGVQNTAILMRHFRYVNIDAIN